MCHDNSNVETLMTELESATEHLSNVQERINQPMFDLLFKLVNTPQTAILTGSKLKVLHTYAHRFMEFYMTGCPDGVSTPTMSADAIYDVANTLRSLGDGLSRLLTYLGMALDSEQLTEYVDVLAVAYDTVGAVLAQSAFCDDDMCRCDECDCCGCDDEEDETSWVNEHHEDDDADEFDPCADCSDACSKNSGTDKCDDMERDAEAARKFFEMLFGLNPDKETPTPKEEPKPEKKPTVKIRMTQPNKNASAEDTAKRIAKLLGLDEDSIDFEYITPDVAAKSRVAEVKQMQEEMEAAAKRAARMLGTPMFREVTPGFWRFG